MNEATKATIEKTVTTANENALKAYESSVNSQLEAIKTIRANVKQRTESYEADIAYQASLLVTAKAKLAALTPPAKLTAADIYGTDIAS